MGNDGGSIPTRRELVKEAARNPTTTELKESQHEQQEYYWTTDPISHRPLTRPIVSDQSGKLYNKETIIEYLLPSDDAASKTEVEKILQGAVKSLKDVVEVKFEVDPEASTIRNSNGKTEKWICPITHKTLGPGSKAVYLVPCGHAFSDSAIKEVAGEKCLQCNEPYAPNDIIPIIPTTTTDIARLSLRARTLAERGLTHSLKKAPSVSKKRKKNNFEADSSRVVDTDGTTDALKDRSTVPSNPITTATPSLAVHSKSGSGIKNASTASLTAKVLQEQEERNKRRKMEHNSNIKSLFTAHNSTKPLGKSNDFMSRGFTIPANAKR